MSLQDLVANYPEGCLGPCIHGMVDDGIDCIQCKIGQVQSDLDDALGYIDDWDEDPEEADYTNEIRPLLNRTKQFVNKINPEIDSWKRVVSKLTHEKAVSETRCQYYEKGLRLIVEKCIQCPDTASFASHMLDGTVQLHTDSVIGWSKDCDECHGMGFIKGWIYNNNQEIPCPKCNKNWGESNG